MTEYGRGSGNDGALLPSPMISATVHVRELGFPEGPVALPDGSIAFVDLLHQKVRVYRDGAVRELCKVRGSPNGMRFGPDGCLYVTNNGGLAPLSLDQLWFPADPITGRIHRVSLDGAVEDLTGALPGEGPWRLNDLAFAADGCLIVTDPQNLEVLDDKSLPDPLSHYAGGRLFAVEPNGATRLLLQMSGFPNGLAFHPDGSLLVGLTIDHRIVRLTWNGRSVGPPETWHQFDNRFNPDGMAFGSGLLFVAGSVGNRVAVLDAAGRLVRMIDTGPLSDPTNLCVDAGRLWVTLGLPGQLVSWALQDLLMPP